MSLTESTLLTITLPFQHPTKVNISDNNIEYSTSRIVNITRSYMNSAKIQEYGTLYVDPVIW